ncbi:MAG: prepilin-type N-terminal cleavage/methylation domain-containing protein [Methylococcaceae bacterium]
MRREARTSKLFAVAPDIRHKGFTLIEVLIAMTLLSIMVVLLFTSLKICADSWEKGESKITDVNEVAVVYNFFQRHLSVATPLWNDFSEEDRTFSFQGKSRSLQFISSFPASAARSGLQLFSIQLQEADNQRFVVVTITPFFPVTEGKEWRKEEVALIKHVSDFKLAYFGSDGNENKDVWLDEWLDRDVQPRLVKINIELENEIFWPEMIIELKVTGIANTTEPEINNTDNSENINNSGAAK